MGNSFGHILITDFRLPSRQVYWTQQVFEIGLHNPWDIVKKNYPVQETTLRTTSIIGISDPEVEALGPQADQITNVRLRCEEIKFSLDREKMPVKMPVKINWMLNGVEDYVYLGDAEKPDPKENLIKELVPDGARLVMLHPINWTSLYENNLYLESVATVYAADEQSRLIILPAQELNRDTNWPTQPVYVATSFEQLDQLVANSEPYQPTDPKPQLGPNEFGVDCGNLEEYQSPAEFRMMEFIISYLTEEVIQDHPKAKQFVE